MYVFHFRFCSPAPQKLHVLVIATGLTAPQWLPSVLVLLILRKELKTHRQARARKSRLSVRAQLPDNHVLSGDFTEYIDSCYLYSVSATVRTSLKCLNRKEFNTGDSLLTELVEMLQGWKSRGHTMLCVAVKMEILCRHSCRFPASDAHATGKLGASRCGHLCWGRLPVGST